MDDGVRVVEAGACGAWLLPGNATCAGMARRVFRRVATALGADPGHVDDGETIVSELAANTLHIAAVEGRSELWLYLRGSGPERELVCKVFDSYPGWARGAAPHRGGHAPVSAMSGRGLEVVHELSGGHWGYHLTRARLGGWPVRGKALWFATPAAVRAASPSSPASRGGGERHAGLSSREAMARVQAELAIRGFGATMARADDPATDTAVLSVCGELTVWCRAGAAWLRAPGLDGQKRGYADLVEVAEQAVEAHETLCVGPGLADGEPARAHA